MGSEIIILVTMTRVPEHLSPHCVVPTEIQQLLQSMLFSRKFVTHPLAAFECQDEQNALQKTLQGFLALSSVRVSSHCFTFSFFFSFEQFTFSPLLSPRISTVKLDGFQVWKPTSLRSRGWSSKSPLHRDAFQVPRKRCKAGNPFCC